LLPKTSIVPYLVDEDPEQRDHSEEAQEPEKKLKRHSVQTKYFGFEKIARNEDDEEGKLKVTVVYEGFIEAVIWRGFRRKNLLLPMRP